MRTFRFLNPAAINEALARELAHPSGTMDDPFTAVLANVEDAAAAARASGAVTELLADTEREADWLPLAGVVLVALVALASWLWPLPWGVR